MTSYQALLDRRAVKLLKAVLFDMDGVIIDSEPQHARAAVLALQKYNVDISIDYAYKFIGTTTYHMCSKIIEDFNIQATAEELLKANEVMKDLLTREEGYEAIPYIVDLMKDLHKHGVKMIIASSSTGPSIREVMQYLHIEDIFEGYISGTNVSHPKPAPDIFLAAASQLGVSPDECIVIEDSYNGITAATAAGIPSIGFLNPNSGKQDLSQATILIEGFDEIDYNFINTVYQHAHMLPATILQTDRLFLRELSLEDVEAYCDIANRSGVREYLMDYCNEVAVEIEKHRAYIKNIYHFYGYGLWGIYTKEANRLIGRCGIEYKEHNNEGVYELSYLLDPDYQGQGYASEAVLATIQYGFNQLGITKITAFIEQNNIRSQQLVKRIGMINKGEARINQRECYRYDIVKT
jgi:HAD superfamily hydrolase (TIGR01509 family)